MPTSETKLLPLFLTDSIRNTGMSLMSFFNSIFIYKVLLSAFEIQKAAILGVFVYNIAFYLLFILTQFVADSISLSWGLKKTLFLGQILLAISVGYLVISEHSPIFLIFAAVLSSLASSFYWFSWNCLLTKEGRVGRFGRELGLYSIILTIFSLATPLAGGLLINFFGYPGLFGAAFLCTFGSFLFIYFIKDDGIHHQTSLPEVLGLFKIHPRAFWSYFGSSATATVTGTILPLYLFLILKKELSLGEFFSASMITAAVVTYLVGRWIDKYGGKKPLIAGSVVQFAVGLGRAISKFPPVLLVLDIFDRTSTNMVAIPLSVDAFEKAILDHNTGRAILFREMALALGSATILAAIPLAMLLGAGLEISFLMAAIFSLFPILEIKKAP